MPVARTTMAALGMAGALFLGAAGTAHAEPPAGCTTADMTGVMAGVAGNLAAYLVTHPDVNDYFTGLQGLPKTEVTARTESYLNANPMVRADLESIRQPSKDFRTRCNLPQRALTLPGL